MTSELLLIGYYGYHNVGDDILLSKTITLIRNTYPEKSVQFICHSSSYPLPIPPHETVFYYSRFSLIQIIRAIWKSSAVVFCGGSLFQSRSSSRSLLYYLLIFSLAILFQKKRFLVSLQQEFLEK